MRLPVLLLGLICLLAGVSTATAQRTETNSDDSIRILDVTPSAPVKDGVQNEFTVQIEYTLQSADEAMAALGFNSDNPGSFRMTGRKKISRGTNVLTLKGIVKPKDWKERGDFIVYVNLMPYPAPKSRFRPYASAEKVIDFEP